MKMKSIHINAAAKSHLQFERRISRRLSSFTISSLLLTLTQLSPLVTRADEARKTFASPEEAVRALAVGAKAQDQEALRAIFGPDLERVENPDRVQATNECAA